MTKHKNEKIGEFALFAEMIVFSLFPLIINEGVKTMPPIFFASISLFAAALCFFIYLLITRQLKKVFNKKVLKLSFIITLLVVVIPYFLIFTGTKSTSGISTAIFLQTEILFALIFCTFWLKEKLSKVKIFSSLAIFTGAVLVLYNGNFALNTGDLLVILGTAIYPIGNSYSKDALKISSPMVILFIRSLLGGAMLLILSAIFEGNFTQYNLVTKDIQLIIANGLGMLFLGKILWYIGLKYLDLTKATAISMAYPIFTLMFAAIFLKELPTAYQVIGLTIIMVGVYLTTLKSRTSDVNSF